MAWDLYRDLRGVARDIGVHASCAPHLACALMGCGVDGLAGACRVTVDELRGQPRVGPEALRLARAVGVRETGA